VDLLVNLDVDHIDNAIAFYSAVFDLRVGRRFGEGAVEMLGSSAPIYLLARAAGTPVSSATMHRRSYERHWTPIHLDFVVDNIDSAVERAISVGALLEGPIVTHKWGRIALMADPFGHGFCFVQFLGAGYDEIAE
jgi:predicted enzyme related to lactoylglutathione lyase